MEAFTLRSYCNSTHRKGGVIFSQAPPVKQLFQVILGNFHQNQKHMNISSHNLSNHKFLCTVQWQSEKLIPDLTNYHTECSNSNGFPLHRDRWILGELVRLRAEPQFSGRIQRMASAQLVHVSLAGGRTCTVVEHRCQVRGSLNEVSSKTSQ